MIRGLLKQAIFQIMSRISGGRLGNFVNELLIGAADDS